MLGESIGMCCPLFLCCRCEVLKVSKSMTVAPMDKSGWSVQSRGGMGMPLGRRVSNCYTLCQKSICGDVGGSPPFPSGHGDIPLVAPNQTDRICNTPSSLIAPHFGNYERMEVPIVEARGYVGPGIGVGTCFSARRKRMSYGRKIPAR